MLFSKHKSPKAVTENWIINLFVGIFNCFRVACVLLYYGYAYASPCSSIIFLFRLIS